MTSRVPVIDVDRPANAAVVDASEIHAYLIEQGLSVDGVSIDKNGRVTIYDVEHETDVRAAIAAYRGRPKARHEQLADIIAAIEAKPEVSRTLAERAILLLVQ